MQFVVLHGPVGVAAIVTMLVMAMMLGNRVAIGKHKLRLGDMHGMAVHQRDHAEYLRNHKQAGKPEGQTPMHC